MVSKMFVCCRVSLLLDVGVLSVFMRMVTHHQGLELNVHAGRGELMLNLNHTVSSRIK